MILKTARQLSMILSLGVLLTGLGACSKSDKPDTENPGGNTESVYSFRVFAGNPGAGYILQAGSLTSGKVSTVGNGALVNVTTMTTKKGFYYGIDEDSGNLVKYTADNKSVKIVKEIPFNQISWAFWSSTYVWKDDQTLVLISCNGAEQYEYAILNVESMTFTSFGKINIPAPAAGKYYWGNSVVINGDKLYIAYSQIDNVTKVLDGDTYLASVDFPSMGNVKVTKDSRFTHPSHYTLHMQGTFVDNGTAYFMASPTIWSVNAKDKPFGIFRVNKNATEIDKTYFYELVDKNKEEAMGMFYLGNGKTIVKVLDRTQITSTDSYSNAYITDYYVVDVVKQTKTKLDIPKSISLGYNENVFVENGVANIVAPTSEGYYVYQYNVATGAVTRGIKIEGISSLFRIERMK